MNSPYMGDFRISQKYSKTHTGLDLVGINSKEIHSTVNGVVSYAGWENTNNHLQGFGQYVRIKDSVTGFEFYYGHLSEIKVKQGQIVKITDVIGIEGSTGKSSGSHCHYEIRTKAGVQYRGSVNVSDFSKIPNVEGGIFNDGFNENNNNIADTVDPYLVKINVETVLNVRNEPTTQAKINTTVKNGVYTITEEKWNDGRLWGKLKSGVGWIALEYTQKL